MFKNRIITKPPVNLVETKEFISQKKAFKKKAFIPFVEGFMHGKKVKFEAIPELKMTPRAYQAIVSAFSIYGSVNHETCKRVIRVWIGRDLNKKEERILKKHLQKTLPDAIISPPPPPSRDISSFLGRPFTDQKPPLPPFTPPSAPTAPKPVIKTTEFSTDTSQDNITPAKTFSDQEVNTENQEITIQFDFGNDINDPTPRKRLTLGLTIGALGKTLGKPALRIIDIKTLDVARKTSN